MALPQFLKDVKQECLLFHIDEAGKKVFDKRCFGKNYTLEQVEALQQENQQVGIMYYIKDTNYVVIDIDTDDYSIEDIYNDSGIDSCYVKGNTKGWHIWMEMKSKTDEFKKNKVDCGLYSTIDFLGEKVFEVVGKEWNYEPCYINEDHIANTFKKSTFEKRLVSQSKTTTPCDNELMVKLIGLIDIKYCDNRSDWLKIVMAIKKIGLSFDVADNFSKRSSKYDETGMEITWNSYSVDNITSTEGTIRYYAKKSNPTEYNNLTNPEGTDVINIPRLINLKPPPIEEDPKMAIFNDLNKTAQNELKQKIKTQEEEHKNKEIQMKINYFEKFHFKVMHPVCFGRLAYNKIHLLTGGEIETEYENVNVGTSAFIPIWRKSHNIRTYENVDFLPYPKECKPYTLNTFNGLKASRITSGEGDFSIFLNHIDILSGHDKAGTEYLINYLAHLIQRPGELPRVALVFQSEQGVGKNVFFEYFAKQLLGIEYLLATADMDKVIGRFPMINNKLMVIMDETSGKDSFSNSDKIKNIITAEQIAWERKGIDGTSINNCGRYLFFSNNLTPVKIEQSDRRYVVFKCANDVQNKTDYFDNLITAFKDQGTIKSFYEFLLNRDVSKWDSINHRPITKAYSDIKSANTPPMATYLIEQMVSYENADSTEKEMYTKQPALDIYNNFKIWLSQNGFTKMDYTSTKFGREICDYEGIDKKRSSGGMNYTIDFAKLKEFIDKKGWNV